MGLKVYDLPPGGLEDGAVATPSKDVTFTWTYNQEELDKTEPLPKDIQIIKKTEPDASEDEVILLAKQKRYRKTKTIEMRKQYEDFEKEGKLEELPLDNIFNLKFQPTPPPSENGMSIVMRPQAAVHMMKVEIPLEAIDELNTHIEEELDGAVDFSDKLVGQINRNELSSQRYFGIDDDAGKAFASVLEKLAVTYMKNVTTENYDAEVSGAWTVHSYEGDYNPLHDHGTKTPMGLSCIFYLKVPEQISNLTGEVSLNNSSGATDGFTYLTWGTNGHRDVNMLRPVTEEYVKPVEGTLIMFPSWLRHSVNPFFGEGERRTFSANISINPISEGSV